MGFNPSPRSWRSGHHYAHPGNLFWNLLSESGLTPVRLSPEDDRRLPEIGLGFTDVVGRPSASASALTTGELRAGGVVVRAQLLRWRPRVAAYTGKGVYRAVAGVRAGAAVSYGVQTGEIAAGVTDFVLPSPSGRSGLPRGEKLGWYRALATLLAGPALGPARCGPVGGSRRPAGASTP